MKLNIQDRLILAQVLPEKGNFETMDTVDKLRKVLFLSEDEVEKYGFKQNGDKVSWNKEGFDEVEVEISDKGKALLLKELERLDNKEELNFLQFEVYKKIKE